MLERLKKMFPNGIPGYLLDALGLRQQLKSQRKQEARQAKEQKEAKFQRKRSLRRPPAKVWLERVGTHGMEVHWLPPKTAHQLNPTGYIVKGDSDSTQLLPPDQRKQWLRIYKPGNCIGVEVDYSSHQITKLGEHTQFTKWVE